MYLITITDTQHPEIAPQVLKRDNLEATIERLGREFRRDAVKLGRVKVELSIV